MLSVTNGRKICDFENQSIEEYCYTPHATSLLRVYRRTGTTGYRIGDAWEEHQHDQKYASLSERRIDLAVWKQAKESASRCQRGSFTLTGGPVPRWKEGDTLHGTDHERTVASSLAKIEPEKGSSRRHCEKILLSVNGAGQLAPNYCNSTKHFGDKGKLWEFIENAEAAF
ncbi:hypothetical protein PR048_009250 [Dryococelus australis]|uniref:Uncharacterized protein n=1 Tax=Dryococelus australis TaxID=614101 RepID=A0ABQ9I0A5_9NEOP|nr:hypothetical protein PR048_009250 [Dryococelus australis]